MSEMIASHGGGEAVSLTMPPKDLSEARDWLLLLKPRVVVLVVLTGLVGLVIAPGTLHPVLALIAILCIAVAAGAAGAINMWYDRDIDLKMRRTATRPIPAGRVPPSAALAYGVTLSVGSVVMMFLATNWLSALMLAVSIAFYVFVYTMWLKRRTPQNIVIGGAAGAFPPIIGWAAVTSDVALAPMVLFTIIFLWTPPHFWALSLYACKDYAAAGVPMLPVVAGQSATRLQILLYTLVLAPVGVSPWLLGFAGPAYAVVSGILGFLFIACAIRVWRDQATDGLSLQKDLPARQMFKFSLIYLALLFAALAGEYLLRGAL